MSLQKVYAIDSVREWIGGMLAGCASATDTATDGVEDIARPCLTCRDIFTANFGRLFELQSEHSVYMQEIDHLLACFASWIESWGPSDGLELDCDHRRGLPGPQSSCLAIIRSQFDSAHRRFGTSTIRSKTVLGTETGIRNQKLGTRN